MKISELKVGDPCRATCTAIGRYIGNKKVLFVSAMCNDLFEGDLKIPIDQTDKYDLPKPSMKQIQEHLKASTKCSHCGK